MPNHCYNAIRIVKEDGDLTEFMDKHCPVGEDGTRSLDFNTFIPYPEKFAKQDAIAAEAQKQTPPDYSIKDGFNSGGYEWCCDYWGTKWNAYDQKVGGYPEDGYVDLEFYTAWAPPAPIFAKMCELYPELDITFCYEEAGMAFEGGYENVKGELVQTYRNTNSKRILRGG